MDDGIPQGYDPSFLRDMTDIVKNKTLYFVPFFGAYMAFIIGKADYLRSSNPAIWVICATIFFVSVKYIHASSQLLRYAEQCRLVFNLRKTGVDVFGNENHKDAIVAIMKKIPDMSTAEDYWFRKVMLLFYIGTFCVLEDLFFGEILNRPLAAALRNWILRLL